MVPSLENICELPLVVAISNHPDVKKQIFSSSTEKLFQNDDEQKRWENAINKQTSEILKDYNPILKSTFPRLRVKFIGIEMLKWTENLQTCFDLPLKFSQDFIKSSFFTPQGFIDEEKAARELIKEQSLSLLLKYKVACHFYLQDIIPNLWKELENNEPNFQKILSELSSETAMVMWSNYLGERKSTSVRNQPFLTNKFKAKVFSCGIETKNVAAVKFILDAKGEFRNSKEEEKIKIKLLHQSFYDCQKWIWYPLDMEPSLNFLLSKEIVTCCNFIDYILSTKHRKKLLKQKSFYFDMLEVFLHWPYQYKFMKLADLSFDKMDEMEYLSNLECIISFILNENLNSSYNYRLLLREFWIKGQPSCKKFLMRPGGEIKSLIIDLFNIRQFTLDDMQNVYLMVKDVSLVKKKKIFQIIGQEFCGDLCSLGNYKIANIFFNVLEIDQETIKTFKKDFAFYFLFCIIEKNTECVTDEFFKWILGTDKIDELKAEFFYTLTRTNNIENLFKYLPEENKFSLLDKTLKLFLETDDKIEEWKKITLYNVTNLYSPLIRNTNHDWFNELLMYLRASGYKTSDIKKDVLLRNFPKIAKCIYQRKFFVKNILFLCLYNKKRIRNFIHKLRAFYQDSITHNMCLLCKNNTLVSSNGDDAQLQCENHGTHGFISPDNINVICSSFSTRIYKALIKHPTFIKKSLKRKVRTPFLE